MQFECKIPCGHKNYDHLVPNTFKCCLSSPTATFTTCTPGNLIESGVVLGFLVPYKRKKLHRSNLLSCILILETTFQLIPQQSTVYFGVIALEAALFENLLHFILI